MEPRGTASISVLKSTDTLSYPHATTGTTAALTILALAWMERRPRPDTLVLTSKRTPYTPSRKEMNTLRLLGIVPPDFNLDDPSSLHRVNDVWHIASDKLALWSWAPCIGTVHFLLGILQTERIGRQAYYQQHKKAPWRKWNPTWVEAQWFSSSGSFFIRKSNLPDATSPHHELFQKLDALVDEIYRPLELIPDIPPLYPRDALAPADVLAANSVLQVDSMLSPTSAFPTYTSPADTDYNLESMLLHVMHVPPVGLRERIAYGQALLFKPIEDWEDPREDLTGVVDGAQTGTSPIDALAATEVSPADKCYDLEPNAVTAHLPPEDLQERIAYGKALLFKPIEDWHLAEARLEWKMAHTRGCGQPRG
ncbi:hypothetical protein C8J57DRAFT_1734486 [Mycena rebaudengoi]|nr:hypothetical protein C8J57DRAFT_1734486 [Mycena rebaudengoi]